MKKYITIATLFAAGSAFANAATVVDVDSFTFTSAGGYAYTVDDLTFTLTSSGGLKSGEANANATGNSAWFFSEKQELLFSGDYADNAWAKDLYSDYIMGANKGDHLTMTISGFSANQIGISLSFVAGCQFEGAGAWAPAAVLNENNSTALGVAEYVGSNATNVSSIALPASSTISPFGPIVYSFDNLVADANGAISFTVKGVGAHSAAISAISVVIPEPSAFGLLAGLGALALVGTRRRRR